MRVTAPVTDYIRASVLPSKGDMVVRGDLVPENLAAGAFNTFFRGQGVGELPTYDNLGEVLDTYLKAQGIGVAPAFKKLALRDTGVKIGNSTRNTGGEQIISGVGFQSSLILFLGSDSVSAGKNLSIGVDDGVVHQCIALRWNVGGVLNDPTHSIYIGVNPTNYIIGVVSVIGTDGFTITWTLSNIASVDFTYLCLP